jgi:glutathione S-transferase
MAWVDIVGIASVLQLIAFSVLVGRARRDYALPAPATSGHPLFERYYRVQMNTVETLIAFLPGLWLAAKYWPPHYVAAIGAVYLLGRVLYLRGYVRDPKDRHVGYGLSSAPTVVLLLAALIGAIRSLILP